MVTWRRLEGRMDGTSTENRRRCADDRRFPAKDRGGTVAAIIAGMAPFASVLCAIDFSEHSAQALRQAAALAAASDSSVHVVTVIDPLLAASAAVEGHPDDLTAQAASELREFASTTLGAGVPDPAIHVAVGHAAPEIIRSAATIGADLIVVGTQGLSGVRRLFSGSTTHRALRDAESPCSPCRWLKGPASIPSIPFTHHCRRGHR
jgi:nucleotide-binding universal stress UspA family protein